MSQWSAGDERPVFRETRPFHLWWAFFLVLALAGAGAAYYFLHLRDFVVPPPDASAPAVAPPAPAEAKSEAPRPAEEPPAQAKGLPSLENSDAMIRESVSGLVGRKAFSSMVHPTELVRRIVATVDNLPRETAPRRVMPLQPVPGVFGVSGGGEELQLNAENARRHAAYGPGFERPDAHR